MLQQILSAYNTGDWSFVTENVPKFILGFESILFDTIFMLQHYVLYGDNDSVARQSQAQLLQKENGSIEDKNLNYSSLHRNEPAVVDAPSIVIREQIIDE